jgi:hypothetical protein
MKAVPAGRIDHDIREPRRSRLSTFPGTQETRRTRCYADSSIFNSSRKGPRLCGRDKDKDKRISFWNFEAPALAAYPRRMASPWREAPPVLIGRGQSVTGSAIICALVYQALVLASQLSGRRTWGQQGRFRQLAVLLANISDPWRVLEAPSCCPGETLLIRKPGEKGAVTPRARGILSFFSCSSWLSLN